MEEILAELRTIHSCCPSWCYWCFHLRYVALEPLKRPFPSLAEIGNIAAGSSGSTISELITVVTQKDVHPGDQLDNDPSKPTLVVLGSGWGATSFLKNLDTEEFNVVVVSPRNYFLFTPLLPSVTVGTLEARSIIQPTRYIARHKKRKVAVYEAEAQEVDPIKKTVSFQGT
jgi:hypothetical protein